MNLQDTRPTNGACIYFPHTHIQFLTSKSLFHDLYAHIHSLIFTTDPTIKAIKHIECLGRAASGTALLLPITGCLLTSILHYNDAYLHYHLSFLASPS